MIIPSETNYKKIMAIYIMIYIWISKKWVLIYKYYSEYY